MAKKQQKPAKADGVVKSNAAAHSSALSDLISNLNKDMGDGTIMYGNQKVNNVTFVPTGIATLDAVIGGGIPRGRIIEIYGAEASGKTTTTLEIIAGYQRHKFEDKKHGVCAFIDAEHSLDVSWAKNVGVDINHTLINQPSHGEEAFDIVEKMCKSGVVDLIVVDSVAAMVPKQIIEGSMTDSTVGAQARLMSKGLSKINSVALKSKTSIVFINQIRNKIGVMYGSPETTPGGLALKYYASMRIELRRGESLKLSGKDDGKVIGALCKAKIIKNKVAPPYRNCVYGIYFGQQLSLDAPPTYGVDKIGCLFDAAVIHGVITNNSSFYYFDGQKIDNGRDRSVNALRNNQDLMGRINAAIIEASKPTSGEMVELTDADDDEFDDAIGEGGDLTEEEVLGALGDENKVGDQS